MRSFNLDAMEVYHHPCTELCPKQQKSTFLNHSTSRVRMGAIC